MNARLVVIALAWVFCTPALAQQSASFKLTEQAFNAGGHPLQGVSLASASFRVRLDAIGDGVAGASLTSPSFNLANGLVAPYPPPGEVRNVRFTGASSLAWDREPSVGAYNIYRGAAGSYAGYGTCLQPNVPAETGSVPTNPSPGQAFYFLVTAENRINEEGGKGFASSGATRANPSPCP